MKTLAIRLEDNQHAQLSVLAQLAGLSVTDAIRQAIEGYLQAMRANPELSARAEAVLGDIERDAEERRQAIADLFGSGATGASAPASQSPRRATRGSSEPSSD